MVYNLIITKRAKELVENIIDYLLNNLHNGSATIHLLDSIEKIYERIENNPYFHQRKYVEENNNNIYVNLGLDNKSIEYKIKNILYQKLKY
jgi:hypothetical protein